MNERLAEQGLVFSSTLHAMSEELYDLASNSEKGRKHWKQFGLNAERRVQDAELAMDKAKGKYYSLAEQFDKVKTGERTSGKFGIKKNAAQHEEELQRKVETADSDYASKTQYAQTQQHELLSTLRPQTINALQDLIYETDAALASHVQKFAVQSEKLLLGYGLNITPLKAQSSSGMPVQKSLRELAASIDNEHDFADYVLAFTNQAEARPNEIKYEKHPSFATRQQQQSQFGGYGPGAEPHPSNPPQYGGYHSSPPPQSQGQFGSYQETSYDNHGGQQQYPPQQPHHPAGFGYGSGSQSRPAPEDQLPFQSQAPARPPQQARQQSFGPPQLPQIDGLGSGQFSGQSTGVVSADSPSSHNRNVSLPFGSQVGGAVHPARGASLGPQGESGDAAGPPQDRSDSPGPNSISDPRHQASSSAFGPGPWSTPPPHLASEIRPAGTGYPPQQQGITNSARGGAPPVAPESAGQTGPQAGPPAGTAGPGAYGNTGLGREVQDSSRTQAPPGARGPNGSTESHTRMPEPFPVATPPAKPPGGQRTTGPPTNPIFGVSLDELFRRDESAVPTIVYQCIQAVDLYGLDTEGIYRISGSANHIMEIRQKFDQDATQVDFRSAASFYNDIASVTTLLKHFLRDLPDPLLTNAQYSAYIQAAKIEDEIVRRDSIHALVNALPDPNYATLRVLALHLNRVANHSDRNKMTHGNLAIVFAPTLMGQGKSGPNSTPTSPNTDIADAGWQAKVVETILVNTLQIFDDDE
ncbi:hypothetical protein, variant [Exophiala mesophila]|nr:hypothetical protein, variant [Exophiala mesophila]KIV89369.1 hypothetical protein, variant [Exophiala mesophila]